MRNWFDISILCIFQKDCSWPKAHFQRFFFTLLQSELREMQMPATEIGRTDRVVKCLGQSTSDN